MLLEVMCNPWWQPTILRPPGRYIAIWCGMDDSGMDVASGVYFYRIEVDGVATSRQTALVR